MVKLLTKSYKSLFYASYASVIAFMQLCSKCHVLLLSYCDMFYVLMYLLLFFALFMFLYFFIIRGVINLFIILRDKRPLSMIAPQFN